MGLEDDQDLLLAIALSKSLMVEREGEDDDEAETSATSKDAALLEANIERHKKKDVDDVLDVECVGVCLHSGRWWWPPCAKM